MTSAEINLTTQAPSVSTLWVHWPSQMVMQRDRGPVWSNLDLSMSAFHPSREGEFTVEVLAFNNISSAVLRKQLFIVHEPCQPPPVKNMGPKKVQVGLGLGERAACLNTGCFETAELAGE